MRAAMHAQLSRGDIGRCKATLCFGSCSSAAPSEHLLEGLGMIGPSSSRPLDRAIEPCNIERELVPPAQKRVPLPPAPARAQSRASTRWKGHWSRSIHGYRSRQALRTFYSPHKEQQRSRRGSRREPTHSAPQSRSERPERHPVTAPPAMQLAGSTWYVSMPKVHCALGRSG